MLNMQRDAVGIISEAQSKRIDLQLRYVVVLPMIEESALFLI